MKESATNRRKNLRVPQLLLDRLEYELNFLGIHSRQVVVESRAIESRNDFVKAIATHYRDRFFDGLLGPVDFNPDIEIGNLQFYLDRKTEGLWDSAIREGAANDYNHLVSSALQHYFQRQDDSSRELASELAQVVERLKSGDINELRRSLHDSKRI